MKSIAVIGICTLLLTGCAIGPVSPLRVQSVSAAEGGLPPESIINLIGGPGWDDSRNAKCDSLGSCWLFGYTNKSFGGSTDFLVVHLVPSGKPDWARTYGGTNWDEMLYATTTNDHGALLVGMTESLFYTALKIISPHKPPRPLIVRIDEKGDVVWVMAMDLYPTMPTERLEFHNALQLADGGFLLAGIYQVAKENNEPRTGENGWTWSGATPSFSADGYNTMALARLSADGHVIWLKRYAIGTADTAAWGVHEDVDGHLTVLAYDTEKGDLIWVHLNSDGHVLNAQLMTQPTVAYPFMYAAPDGGETIVGWSRVRRSQSSQVKNGVFAASYDSIGKLRWAKEYAYVSPMAPFSAAYASDGTLCIAALINSGDQSRAIALALDSEGQLKGTLKLGDKKPTEFSGVSGLGNAKCLLFGDTFDYGAQNADLLTVVWNLAKGSLSITPDITSTNVQLTMEPIELGEATADITNLYLLPVSLLNVVVIPVDRNTQH